MARHQSRSGIDLKCRREKRSSQKLLHTVERLTFCKKSPNKF